MVGQYALGLAITAPIYMLLNFQLRAIQATETKKSFDFSIYFTFRLISTLFAYLSILFVVFLLDYSKGAILVILLIGLHKAIDSFSDVIYGLLQKNERMDLISKSLILKGIFSFFVFVITLLITNNIVFSISGLLIGSVIVLLFYDFKNYRLFGSSLKIKLNFIDLKKLLKIGLPLGLAMMLISLNTNVPRYFIEQNLGIEELGFFAAIAYILLAGSMIINSLGQAVTPRLAKYYASNNFKLYKNLLFKLMLMGLILGVSVIIFVSLFGKTFLTIIYTAEYANFSNVLFLLMIGATINFLTSFLGYAMTAARIFNSQPIIFTLALLVNIILCVLLIPKYYLIGASIAIIISSGVQLLGNIFVIYYALYKKNNSL